MPGSRSRRQVMWWKRCDGSRWCWKRPSFRGGRERYMGCGAQLGSLGHQVVGGWPAAISSSWLWPDLKNTNFYLPGHKHVLWTIMGSPRPLFSSPSSGKSHLFLIDVNGMLYHLITMSYRGGSAWFSGGTSPYNNHILSPLLHSIPLPPKGVGLFMSQLTQAQIFRWLRKSHVLRNWRESRGISPRHLISM